MARLLAAALALVAASGLAPDVEHNPTCRHCGMDRARFAHSRMLVEYEDGTSVGTCSLRCAAVELAVSLGRTPRAIRVGDHGTRELVDAERAAWVLGGDAQGVMTRRAKWAFRDRAAAEAFVARHGGAVVGFEDAMRAAYEDLYQDTQMIRARRAAARAPGTPGTSR